MTFTVLTGLTSMARRRQTKTKEGEVEETVSARRRSSGGGGGGGGVEAAANCGENDGVGGGEEERKRERGGERLRWKRRRYDRGLSIFFNVGMIFTGGPHKVPSEKSYFFRQTA